MKVEFTTLFKKIIDHEIKFFVFSYIKIQNIKEIEYSYNILLQKNKKLYEKTRYILESGNDVKRTTSSNCKNQL